MTSVLPQLRSRNLVDDAVAALRRYILDGAFGPGGELPSQGSLCEELRVSRSVIREAMKVLESQGLVEVSQGRRPRVLPVNTAAVVGTLGTLVERSEMSLMKLVEVRTPLEVEIAGLAAERADDDQLERLHQAVVDLAQAETLETQAAADVLFHQILAEASGNALFGIVLEVLSELLNQSRRHTIQTSGVAMALEYHQKILAAVGGRDPLGARDMMQRHMDQTRVDLEQFAKL